MKKTNIITRSAMLSMVLIGLFATTNLLAQETELFAKVGANDIDAVKALIAAGADVNYQQDDMMGYTALGLAKDTVMMKVLISAGADINHQDTRTGYTPLMNALNGQNISVAGFLIRQGADVKIKSNDGTTALILACGSSEKIARQLIDKGADIHALTDKGNGVFTQCTSVGLSRETVSYEFAEFLLAQGADIDEANTTDYYGGYTPLFWAVERGNDKVVSFLVKNGANVNAVSNKGKTPLSLATEAGASNIVEILKAAGAK
ncbi:ankyrin repeat domain-containing protein [Marinilabilia salmonicolor]|uniref:ankyrin repeat domain-containing protein n=1 Tax=Marinilabilia salmonicolor TaxID=989 RepID=UPI00029B14DA|nr:ankyrin repeat domain-containing protein [Marinilabilia salmonicolor]